jgi:N-acyl-D-amino-acid deacylase
LLTTAAFYLYIADQSAKKLMSRRLIDMAEDFELVIKGGKVLDGTSSPWFRRDIGIANGKIKSVSPVLGEGSRVIDATGLVVAPGFIDLHNHADHGILAFPDATNYLMQGVTTSVTGNCGLTLAPVNPANLELLKTYLSPFMKKGVDYGWDWRSLNEFYQKVETQGTAMNLAPLVGQGTIRLAVMGFRSDSPTREEMNKMKELLTTALDDGAFGMSTGLIYPPGSYSSTEELIEMASLLTNYGAIYTTHIRNEGDNLIESVDEAIRIAEENNISLEISHHKAAGTNNYGKVNGALKVMAEARQRGVEVNCDVYPYIAGSSTITSALPNWVLEGGIPSMLERLSDKETRKAIESEISEDRMSSTNRIKSSDWRGIQIADCPLHPEYEGKSLEQIFEEKGTMNSPYQAFFDWLLETEADATVVMFSMDEDDVRTVIANPLSSIISDAWVTSPDAGGKPHPRAYGTFPRVLGHYVREEKILSLEQAVRKMTSMPAAKIGLKERGLIREGFYADLVVFNPDTIIDRATFAEPHRYAEGVQYVLVNGQLVVDKGKPTGLRPGKILRP